MSDFANSNQLYEPLVSWWIREHITHRTITVPIYATSPMFPEDWEARREVVGWRFAYAPLPECNEEACVEIEQRIFETLGIATRIRPTDDGRFSVRILDKNPLADLFSNMGIQMRAMGDAFKVIDSKVINAIKTLSKIGSQNA
jgi:hypothetical protein